MKSSDGIEEAHLPQARKLKRREQTRRIIYHTTGRNLARLAARSGHTPGMRAFDEAALAWYRSSGHPYFGCYLVGTSGVVFELAPPDTWCQHAASLTEQEATSPPPAWWARRWPGLGHPIGGLLQGSRHINATSLGVDLLPFPDAHLPDLHGQATLQAAAQLGRSLAGRYGLTTGPQHHLGHEDVDPWSRSNAAGPWDPGWRRADFLNMLNGGG